MTHYIKLSFLLLLFTNLLSAYSVNFPTLDRNELKFKPLNNYTFNDFKLSRKIRYLELISFRTKDYTGRDFKLQEPFKYDTLLSVGALKSKELAHKAREILGNLIVKENYFWKWQEYPTLKYRYILLNYYEKRDARMKAIENKREILDILKRIDTEAELLLWVKAINRANSKPYSYKYSNRVYRVRFFEVSENGCHIKEYFEYFNKKGALLKTKLIKDENIKGCSN